MPLLIGAVLFGLVVFYYQSIPVPPAPPGHAKSAEVAVVTDAPPPITASPAPLAKAKVEAALPLLVRGDVSENDFTPWMTSLALDTYIRQKNRGYRGSFWSRGNWIRSIEGRWNAGTREFRIALGTMSRPGEIQWSYRLDLTEMAFADELARLGEKGFHLAQSQAYRHPDGTKRYQAVWQRAEAANVAGR